MQSSVLPSAKPVISFVIAVFRNAGSLAVTYEETKALFANRLPQLDFEIVFVNDGSDDGSLEELLGIQKKDPLRVRVISFSRNFGQIAAIIAGFKNVKGCAAINRAADQQEPIEAVYDLILAWQKGAKVVLGQRVSRQDAFLDKYLGNLFWYVLNKATPQMPRGSDFFLLDRCAVDAFNSLEESNRFVPADVLWLGFRPVQVGYNRQRRRIGISQWSLSRKLKMALDALLHASYLPIRFISLVGFGVACSGFLFAIYFAWLRLTGPSPFPGWTSIIIALVILHGITMVMVGVIGEYVWRIFHEAKKRPNYIIETTTQGP